MGGGTLLRIQEHGVGKGGWLSSRHLAGFLALILSYSLQAIIFSTRHLPLFWDQADISRTMFSPYFYSSRPFTSTIIIPRGGRLCQRFFVRVCKDERWRQLLSFIACVNLGRDLI
jgi:hypothetical protein